MIIKYTAGKNTQSDNLNFQYILRTSAYENVTFICWYRDFKVVLFVDTLIV